MYFMAVVERGTGKYSSSNTLWFGCSFLLLLFFYRPSDALIVAFWVGPDI